MRATAGDYRATLLLAWPLVLANLSQVALTTIDTILVGRLGPEALAAAALGTNLYFACAFIGIGLVSATSPLLAEEIGRRRHVVREVRRTVRQGAWAASLVTVGIWLVLWNGEALLLAIGQEPRLARAAGAYLHALQPSLLPFLLFGVLRFFMSALERPGWALAVSVLALPMNGVLAFALIHGRFGAPELGLVGTGIATTITNTLMLLALGAVVAFGRRFRRWRLFGRFWRPDLSRLLRIWRLGLPIAGTLAFEVGLFNAAAMAMGIIGPEALAAHAVALQIASISFMVPLGIGQAATIRVGIAFGAGDRDGIDRAGTAAAALGIGFMAATAILLVAMPGALVGAFLDRDDPANAAVVPLAVAFLFYAALFQLADGAQAVASGMLRGLQDARVPMIYAGLGYWALGAPLGLLLAFPGGLRGHGIWIGLAGGLTVTATLMLWRWTRRDRLVLRTQVRPAATLAPPP